MSKKWFGRLGYDNEGIVKERTFETKAEAIAYARGCQDAMNESEAGYDLCGCNPLEDYWAVYSAEPSFGEGE